MRKVTPYEQDYIKPERRSHVALQPILITTILVGLAFLCLCLLTNQPQQHGKKEGRGLPGKAASARIK